MTHSAAVGCQRQCLPDAGLWDKQPSYVWSPLADLSMRTLLCFGCGEKEKSRGNSDWRVKNQGMPHNEDQRPNPGTTCVAT